MEQKWMTAKIQYDGFPLYLRKPEYTDIFAYRHTLPRVLHVTHKLKAVKSNGLPESDYNMSLSNFDGQMCKLFDNKIEGLIFLIETFAGKRNYYYFISEAVDYKRKIEEIKMDHLEIEIETNSYPDNEWNFLKEYPTKLY